MIWLLYGGIAALIVAADQVTKWLVMRGLPNEGDTFVLWEGVFRFQHVNNTGAAFGSLKGARWLFMAVSVLAIAGMIFYLLRYPPKKKLGGVAVSMIVGGGIGNMIDRIARGYVVDFLDFCAVPKLWSYVFNVADVFVCVGCGLLLVYLLAVEFPAEKKAAAEKAAEASKHDGA